MKKFLLVLTAAIMAVAMCVGLAACSDDEPEDKGVAAESITLSIESVTLDINGTNSFTYTVVPAEADVKVEISDNTVVKYENDTLTAITAGTATVKVYSVADTSVYAECAVTVNVPTGFTAYTASNYKFIYPTGWTKANMSGVDAYYQNSSTGSSVNIISSSKNDPSWTITESSYKTLMTTQYERLHYTVNSMEVTIKDDTYMGGKRRHVTCDTNLTYGITFNLHQEQVILQSSSNSYVLTITYSGEYNSDDISLMISQFAVYN